VTTLEYSTESATAVAPRVVPKSKGRIFVNWITSTDHKTIGYMYLISAFIFFCMGGTMALLMRIELFEPGMQILQTKEQFNQLFTMHGTLMLLMFGTPLFTGLANVLIPLQIGAPDVAFPRLNALAFWLVFELMIKIGFCLCCCPNFSVFFNTTMPFCCAWARASLLKRYTPFSSVNSLSFSMCTICALGNSF